MMTDDGTRLVKLFFHITADEQLRRFEARLHDPMKRWKLSFEDFRNRRHWDDYVVATEEMLARTSKVEIQIDRADMTKGQANVGNAT